MSNTRRLINLATKLAAAETDREAAIRQLATEAQGDRALVRRAHRRLTREYLPTDQAETAATLLGALLDPTRGWATEADDLDQHLLHLVRDLEAQMRVLVGGDPRRLREAAGRLPGETPERTAVRAMLLLAIERAERARRAPWPAGGPEHGPDAPARRAAEPVILDLPQIEDHRPGGPGHRPG
jgi:hypothetical protein